MIGYIDKFGVYHPAEKVAKMLEPDSSQYKAWDHDRQRAEHQYELIQPYGRDGRPNPEFIEAYPNEARANGMRWENRSE